MDYYRDLVTSKSWKLLQKLAGTYRFILIGGWAVWLYTKRLKSKDIDMIVEPETLSTLRDSYTQLTKNDRLKKYEIIDEEIHIDIYVPYYSQLGIEVSSISSHTTVKEGFRVPTAEILLILKLTAYQFRKGSSKGQKDLIDIVSLLKYPGFGWKEFLTYASKVHIEIIKEILQSHTQMSELGLNSHHFSKLKKTIIGNFS